MALSYEDIIKMGKIDAPAPPVEEAGMLSRIGQGLTSNLELPMALLLGLLVLFLEGLLEEPQEPLEVL